MATTTAAARPSFKKGGASAKEQAKRPQFAKTNYLTLDDGDSVVLRFIDDSDDWIYTKQHYAPTKAAPKDHDGKWPGRMGAVCRHDDAFAGLYSDCYICDEMWDEDKDKPMRASVRLWARAVVREDILGTEEMVDEGLIKQRQVGRVVGRADKMIEVEETDSDGKATGKKHEQFDVVIVNMGYKNFFAALQAAYEASDSGTILDRDFRITREGSGTDTDYQVVPLDQIRDENGEVYTLEDPEVREQYLGVVDLEAHIARQASDEHYARYFDPTKTVETKKKASTKSRRQAVEDDDDEDEATTSAQPKRPAVNRQKLADMRNRVKATSAPKGDDN